MKISSILRLPVFSSRSKNTLPTYCWVIVDPPWLMPPALTLERAARRMAFRSTPEWSQNRSSSIAITAFWTSTGMSSSAMSVRFCSPRSSVIRFPLRSHTRDDWAVVSWSIEKSAPKSASKSFVS